MNLSLLRPLLALTTKTELLAALLAGFLSAVCSIGLMGTAAWLISKAALQPPLYALTLGITMVRACGIGRAAFRYLDRWFSHRLAFRCYAQLQLMPKQNLLSPCGMVHCIKVIFCTNCWTAAKHCGISICGHYCQQG